MRTSGPITVEFREVQHGVIAHVTNGEFLSCESNPQDSKEEAVQELCLLYGFDEHKLEIRP